MFVKISFSWKRVACEATESQKLYETAKYLARLVETGAVEQSEKSRVKEGRKEEKRRA